MPAPSKVSRKATRVLMENINSSEPFLECPNQENLTRSRSYLTNHYKPTKWRNYTIWAKSTSLFLYSKSKLGFVIGKIPRPDKFDLSYDEWEANDRIVMSWLFNSMNLVIAEGFVFLDLMKKIWIPSLISMVKGKTLLGFIFFSKR